MGRQEAQIPEDRPAKPLAEYLRAARRDAAVTYRRMARYAFCQYNALSQSVDGRLTTWPVVQRYMQALREAAEADGTADRVPADLEQRAQALWDQARETSRSTGTGTPRSRARRRAQREATPSADLLPPTRVEDEHDRAVDAATAAVGTRIMLDSTDDLVDRLDAMVRSAGYDLSGLRYLALNPSTDPGCRYLANTREARDLLTGKTRSADPLVVSQIVQLVCGRSEEEAAAWAAATRLLIGLPESVPAAIEGVPPGTAAALCERTLIDLAALPFTARPGWRGRVRSALDLVLRRAS
jgi:hypothetical protein